MKAIQLIHVSAVLVVCCCNTAVAQDSGADSNQSQLGVIEEIVVTAQRREQSLQDTPVAVTAVSQATLDANNILSTEGLMDIVPALDVSSGTWRQAAST